jgi:hypothetical protein
VKRLSAEEMKHTAGARWILRALHRNAHLDEVDAALKS